ncbi:hypothetical protein Ddc_10001 [Ditylenchus destructor]|nr:hypothetical protein Ddc_10001 [Ditylenchus destructor]
MYMLVILVLIYGIISWCSYKLWKTFKIASEFISRRTVHELNGQISVALVVQAILPLGMVFIVVAYMGYGQISKASQSSSGITLITLLFHWVPVSSFFLRTRSMDTRDASGIASGYRMQP